MLTIFLAFKRCSECGREGREVYFQSRLLKRTVLVARAQTSLYLAAGLFLLSLKSGAHPAGLGVPASTESAGGTILLVETPKRCSGRRAETKPAFLYPGMRLVLRPALRAGAPLAEALSCEK